MFSKSSAYIFIVKNRWWNRSSEIYIERMPTFHLFLNHMAKVGHATLDSPVSNAEQREHRKGWNWDSIRYLLDEHVDTSRFHCFSYGFPASCQQILLPSRKRESWISSRRRRWTLASQMHALCLGRCWRCQFTELTTHS
jgi:hypothetical protein